MQVAQYVGELCRYLLNTPSKPEDTQHKVGIDVPAHLCS